MKIKTKKSAHDGHAIKRPQGRTSARPEWKSEQDGQSARERAGEGTDVVWPRGVEDRYAISDVTRWRWERDKKLPPRDVFIGGRSGWKPQTLDEYAADPRHARVGAPRSPQTQAA